MKTLRLIGIMGLMGLMLAGCVTKPVNRSNLDLPPVKYAEP